MLYTQLLFPKIMCLQAYQNYWHVIFLQYNHYPSIFCSHNQNAFFESREKLGSDQSYMALHFQCSSNFLQYQILQQPLVNQPDFSSILAKIPSNVFTTRGLSPKQQYKVNV